MKRLLAYGLGLDYIGMVFSALGIYLLGKKKKIGWPIKAFSSMCWIIWAVMTRTYSVIMLDTIYVILCIHGLSHWHKSDKKEKMNDSGSRKNSSKS